MTARNEEKQCSRGIKVRRGEALHARLGIATHVHRQAVLTDPGGGVSFGVSVRNLSYDALNRVWSNSHLFRASVTLAGAN